MKNFISLLNFFGSVFTPNTLLKNGCLGNTLHANKNLQKQFLLMPIMVLVVLLGSESWSQPTVLGTQVANGSYVTYDLVTRGGGVRFVRINATSAGASGRVWEFATGTAGATNYSTNWRPYASGQQLSGFNAYIDPASAASSARYNTGFGGQSGTLPAVVSGSYYTFIVGGNSAANNFMSVLSTTYNPKDITSGSQSPVATSVGVGQPVVVTTTISSALSTNETVYLRYSKDGFANSTITAFSTAGTTLTCTIPGSFNTPSANVSYYIFSSNTATAPSVAQADYFTLNLYNSSGQNASGGGINYTYTVGATTPSYTWNQTGTASWATSTNWTPTRTVVGAYDNMIFNNGATTTVTNIPVETVGGILVSGNTTVNLQPAAAGALTISNGVAGADLSVASGSALNANGASALALTLATGATGSISGNMTFSTSTNTIIVADASGLTFNSGATLTQNTGNTAAIFGTSGTANVVLFASGSTFNQIAGSSPFGLPQPSSKITFQTGSLYKLSNANAPGLAGRTYANFEYDAAGAASGTGGTAYSIDNLTVTQGTLNLNVTVASSVKGNISVASGATLTFSPASVAAVNLNGSGVQTISNAGTLTVAANANLTVVSGSTVSFGTSIITGAGTFTAASGSTLRTGNTAGIASSGATGSVQTTTRSFNAGANYVYNGTTNQITGTGLPATPNTLTINNTGTSPNNVVTLTAITAPTATSGSLTLTAGKLDLNAKQLTIPSGGSIVATAGDFTSTAGPVFFVGTGSVSGTVNFPTVTIAGGVNFGTSATILTSLQINAGGFININVPTYGTGSTLIYNSGTTYGRGLEWSATSGAGYPYHVTLQGNTTLDLGANSGTATARQMAGNLTVTNGSTLTLNNSGNLMTAALTVIGSVNNNLGGTIILSSSIGGDIKVEGDIIDNGTFNFNNRAVFFQGNNTQSIQGSGTFDIPFVRINKGAGSVKMLANLTCIGVNGANAMEIQGTTSVLELNGYTLNLGAVGNSSTFNSGITTAGYIKGSSTSTITILGSGSLGTLLFDQSMPGTTNVLNNLSVNRNFATGNDLVVAGILDAGSSTISGAGGITLPAAATLITSNASGVNGAIATSGTNSLSTSANYTFTGSTAQSTGSLLPATVNNFTISNTSGVTLPQSVTVNGAMSISGTGTSLTINPNAILTIAGTANFGGKSVILKSDNSGDAAIGKITGTLTGATNVTVERYILEGNRAWRLLTAPLVGNGSSNTTIFNNWQNNGSVATGTGVELWGPGGTGAVGSIDSTTGLAYGPGGSIKQYGTGWSEIINTKTTDLFTTTANKAFGVFVTGHFGSGNISNGAATATTLRPTGQLIAGDVSFPISNTIHTLIGNPYASPISPSLILANTENAAVLFPYLWVWDPKLNDFGGYVLYDNGFATYSGGSYSSGTAIQSGQAFFVRTEAVTGNVLKLKESMKSGSVTNTFRNSNSIAASIFRASFLKQTTTDWMPLDGCIAGFYEGANAAADDADGKKMINTGENIGFVRNAVNLSSEHYPLVTAQDILYLKVWNTQQARYKLKLNTEEFTMVGVEAYLQDLYTGTTQPLNLDGSVQDYEFDVDPTVSASSGNRFRIVFTNIGLAVTDPEQGQLSIYPNPATGGKVTVSLPTGNFEGCSYELINVLGQVVRQDEIANANSSQVSIPLTGLPTSWYALRIRKDNKVVYQGKLIINN